MLRLNAWLSAAEPGTAAPLFQPSQNVLHADTLAPRSANSSRCSVTQNSLYVFVEEQFFTTSLTPFRAVDARQEMSLRCQ
jgi:hypothetical protein